MAAIAPNMGLKVWNLLTDPYDHSQLASNWAKVDQHDHSTGKGVQIPTGGIADGAISAAKIGEDQVTDAKILNAPIRGQINNTGAISYGTGFTVSGPTSGVFTITFTVALPSIPIVTGNIVANTGSVSVTEASTTSIKITTQNPSGTAEARAFNFVANPS